MRFQGSNYASAASMILACNWLPHPECIAIRQHVMDDAHALLCSSHAHRATSSPSFLEQNRVQPPRHARLERARNAMTARVRPCLECGRPAAGSRCPEHALPPRGQPHRRARAAVLALATRCAVCGDAPTRDNPLTLGHLRARANGGGLERSNLQAECRRCNLAQGALDRGLAGISR
jgi:5-methylcytosine-specific restriction endonuclease McrA